MSIFEQLRTILTKEAAVLATVIKVKGSVPREVGAKMIITSDGRIFSTIGGGAGEAKVIDLAILALKSNQKQLVEIDLSGTPGRDTQGICGGIMQVWLEPWFPDGGMTLADKISTTLKAGHQVTLITPLDGHSSPYLSPTTETLASTPSFTETLEPPPLLLIVGGGHVGEQLAKVAYSIGFQIIVQDERPNWCSLERYPQAVKIFNQPINEVIRELDTHTQLYAALVTRGYQYDLEALAALLKRETPCQYIGMIGSKKRVNQVYQVLESKGISSKQLDSIYAPIGLEIGALTPEEIAVSIAAELILVRRSFRN